MIYMALIASFTCNVCNKERSECIGAGAPPRTVCSGCLKLESDRKRREHFYGLDGLTVEERMRNIEKWIYDYKERIHPMDIRC